MDMSAPVAPLKLHYIVVFSVTYYLELCKTIIRYHTSHSYQPRTNWLFGHYRTITSLLNKDYINSSKNI